mmetsp:Transcript_13553/g.23312  ORF Transcript_13553/g.23312 Transcript_13553/m.23312 type:complete len:200 (-) Transcript_13553:782-1381(-)
MALRQGVEADSFKPDTVAVPADFWPSRRGSCGSFDIDLEVGEPVSCSRGDGRGRCARFGLWPLDNDQPAGPVVTSCCKITSGLRSTKLSTDGSAGAGGPCIQWRSSRIFARSSSKRSMRLKASWYRMSKRDGQDRTRFKPRSLAISLISSPMPSSLLLPISCRSLAWSSSKQTFSFLFSFVSSSIFCACLPISAWLSSS